MIYAVLTGDIVESSDMPPDALDKCMVLLEKLASDMSAWPSGSGANIPFARRGGDGWQMALTAPTLALRATLYVQASLMAQDPPARSRIAVATGEGTLPTDPAADLNSAHGPVFNASGRLLETISGQSLIAHASGGALDAAFHLADHIAQGWTAAQARAVAAMMPPGAGPRRVAAERLGISRQAIDQALRAAGFPAIEAALTRIEAAA